MKITVRQLQAALRDLELLNIAESVAEKNEDDFKIWKKPSSVIDINDEISQRWKKELALSDTALNEFFVLASKKNGGPQESNNQEYKNMNIEDKEEEPKWLRVARSYIGTKEIAGERSNPAIDLFFKDAGFDGIHDDTAWCAAFVGAILVRSGYPKLGSLAARDFLKYGKKLDKPQVGCIAVLWRESRSSWMGHVGFVTSINYEDKTFKMLGGNQSNTVNISTYSFDRVLGWRLPVGASIKELKEAGSKEAKLSDVGKEASFWTMLLGVIAQTLSTNPDLAKSLMPDVDGIKAIILKLDELLTLVSQYKYGWLIMFGGFFYLLMKQWQQTRVARAQEGQPIMKQVS